MAGLQFKDASTGGYFDREKKPLVYDRNGQPIDKPVQVLQDRKIENPYDR